jgi:amino-acid N-acetyltransferase
MPTVELRPAEPRDREYVERLLDANDLPTADLATAYSSLFVCESAAGETPGGKAEYVGVGGLEIEHGDEGEPDTGLLRSVAVEESARGAGYGTAICERLLDRARSRDLDSVFLLTTTAEDFFAGLGFECVEREDVPDAIRASDEFTDLCPDSAVCMRKRLS